MSSIATENEFVSAATRWLRGLWNYYREYTHTAVHAASAAALTAFGLLIFIDRLFVILAIAAYICPPIILYSIGSDIGKPSSASETQTAGSDSSSASDSATVSVTSDGDTDSGGSDGDTDSDDGDTDSDGNDGDTDSDGTDTDTDTDT